MTATAQTLEALRSTNAVQAEVIAQLRAVLAPRVDFSAIGHFTRHENIILSAIMKWEIATYEQILQALYAGRSSDRPSDKIVGVRVCLLRRKLAPHGTTIKNVSGVGYRMAPECKAKLRAVMEAASC